MDRARLAILWGTTLSALLTGCTHFAAVGRGGPVYAVAVDSVNGHKTSSEGMSNYPVCTIQIGDRVAKVWLADETRGDVESPSIIEGDEEALKGGVLIERTWSQAVVHEVTEEELTTGTAVVYVPGYPKPMVVELRFVRVRSGAANSLRRRDPHRQPAAPTDRPARQLGHARPPSAASY